MFVSRHRYNEVVRDFKAVAESLAAERGRTVWWRTEAGHLADKAAALQEYILARRDQKHLSRVAVQNLLTHGEHTPGTKVKPHPDASEDSHYDEPFIWVDDDQLFLWD